MGYAKPNAICCARQSNGRRVSAISLLAVSSGGCFPAMIAATISGARNVRRTIRVAYEGAIPSSRAISSRVGAPGLNNRLPIFRARRSSLTRLRIRRSGSSWAVNDEFHLHSCSLQSRRNAQLDGANLGAIGGRSRRPTAIPDLRASVFVQKRCEPAPPGRLRGRRDRNATRVRARDRSHQLIQPFPRDTFASSAERGRRVPQPFLHRSIVFAVRDRVQNFDGVGEQRPQSVCDHRFQIGRGNSLTMRLISTPRFHRLP